MPDERHIIKYQKTCAVCGKEFGAWNTNQKFCSQNCKHEASLKSGESYREKQREKAEQQAKECKKKQAVVNIAAEARKAGMSYGKYVAMMNL